jgi:hypothetical protein
MVKTLKRTSKKSYRTLLHRRKINNKLRSKKNGVSKRYSKKAVLKQKGGVSPSIPIKVYIVYEKGKYKVTDDKVTDGEFTTLQNTYVNKLAFVKQMSKLDMRNIIGILYKKDEHDWLFSGLNFCYFEKIKFFGEEEEFDTVYNKFSRAEIPPLVMIAQRSYNYVDNTESIKKAITELCGSGIDFPPGFFTQMKTHSHFSCWIRLQKKGLITFGMKGTGTHKLTSFVYSREGNTSESERELSDPDDIFSEYIETEKIIRGKVKTSESNILITPVKNEGIKMVVESSQEANNVNVNDGDVLFMPYVTTKNYDDYCSDETRAVVDQQRMNTCKGLPLNKVYEKEFEFPGRPIWDKGKFTYSGRGTIAVKFDFSKPFVAEIGKHMLSKLEEFCDFIIASKAIEQKTAYVKKMWNDKDKDKNSIFRIYDYSDIQDIYKPGEFEKFLGVDTTITEKYFNNMKAVEVEKYNRRWNK